MIGRKLGQYEVVEEIGRGGMGVVYRARDTRLQREIALKVLSPELTDDPARRARLVREARAAAALSHPSITVVHAIEEHDDVLFVAMELVRGAPLAGRLAEAPLPPGQALDLAIEIAEGLREGHAHGVVHRDLKPGNVMLTDSGHAKIIDFGLAKRLPGTAPDTDDTAALDDSGPGRMVGTVAYMAPEQARGQEVDARSDIFCFGAVLHELLDGTAAFRRRTGLETLHAVLHDPPPRLGRAELQQAREALQRVVDKCVAKDPESRYQGLADLVVDLRAARRQLDAPGASEAPTPSEAAATPKPHQGPVRIVVVDDEEPARGILREYLSRQADVELVAECRNGFEAVKAVADLEPDLVFLDIQMPKLDGFEVMELIGPSCHVVFVTAFDEHAVKAFEVNALDYLLKPVAEERFEAALGKARTRLGAPPPMAAPDIAAAARPEAGPLGRVLVRDGAQVHVVPVDDIDYVAAQDDYVALHVSGKELLKQQPLSDLESRLDPTRFVRIHRSYLLNLDRLARIESDSKDAKTAVLKDGSQLPVSRSGYSRLKELL